jgi:hypothetical protein
MASHRQLYNKPANVRGFMGPNVRRWGWRMCTGTRVTIGYVRVVLRAGEDEHVRLVGDLCVNLEGEFRKDDVNGFWGW